MFIIIVSDAVITNAINLERSRRKDLQLQCSQRKNMFLLKIRTSLQLWVFDNAGLSPQKHKGPGAAQVEPPASAEAGH